MILKVFVRSIVRGENEAGSEGEHPPFILYLRARLRRSWAHSSPQSVVGDWQEMKSYPALVICVNTSSWWFPLCFQILHSTTGRLPVAELLRLSPLRGGYSSHHCCDERLELLDTHHTITLDSRDSHCWVYSPPAAAPPSTSFPNDRLRRDMSHRSLVRQVSGSVVGDRPRQDRSRASLLVIVLGEIGLRLRCW